MHHMFCAVHAILWIHVAYGTRGMDILVQVTVCPVFQAILICICPHL